LDVATNETISVQSPSGTPDRQAVCLARLRAQLRPKAGARREPKASGVKQDEPSLARLRRV
jgi:hypothetical protein